MMIIYLIPPRSLGFSGGQATRGSKFGRVPDNFIMDDVKCSGREVRLEDCNHNTRDNCGTSEGAGVVCLATTVTTTTATTHQEERNSSSLFFKQMEGGRVGWLTLGVLAAIGFLVLLTAITQKLCSSPSSTFFFVDFLLLKSSTRKATFKILLLVLVLLLIMAILGLVLALRPRKSNDVGWFVWTVVALDGVLLAICAGLLLEKLRKSRKRQAGEVPKLPELPSCPQEGGVANDNFEPEIPSAPPLQLSNLEAEVAPPMSELIQHLLSSVNAKIEKEEAGLECPVCLETASVPIYTCSKQHLICSDCRSNVETCPECRDPYAGRERHRFAEKNREKLEELYEEKKTIELQYLM